MGNSCEEDYSKVNFFFEVKAYGRVIEAGRRGNGREALAMTEASVAFETVRWVALSVMGAMVVANRCHAIMLHRTHSAMGNAAKGACHGHTVVISPAIGHCSCGQTTGRKEGKKNDYAYVPDPIHYLIIAGKFILARTLSLTVITPLTPALSPVGRGSINLVSIFQVICKQKSDILSSIFPV